MVYVQLFPAKRDIHSENKKTTGRGAPVAKGYISKRAIILTLHQEARAIQILQQR